MYFGGHKVQANGDTFLRLPASAVQLTEVIAELESIITLQCSSHVVSCVILHHWNTEARPHRTEGLPRLFATKNVHSCVPINQLIDRVQFAFLCARSRSPAARVASARRSRL